MHAQLAGMAPPALVWPLFAPRSPGVGVPRYVAIQLVLVPLLIAGLAWSCEYSGIDMTISRLFVDPASQGFAGRDSAWLEVLGHLAARALPVLAGGIALCAGVAGFAVAPLRAWAPILLATGAATVLGPLAVNVLRGMTTQHCPIDLQSFGGIVDYAANRAAPFWSVTPKAAGHCLPSGHAAGGYALLSLSFAGWAAGQTRWRWRGLALGLGAGLAFSIVRVAQGAQFASATLWSAAIVWTTCAVLFLPLLCRRAPISG
jgi:membrane-associated PAP2 superfamily phosphatase